MTFRASAPSLILSARSLRRVSTLASGGSDVILHAASTERLVLSLHQRSPWRLAVLCIKIAGRWGAWPQVTLPRRPAWRSKNAPVTICPSRFTAYALRLASSLASVGPSTAYSRRANSAGRTRPRPRSGRAALGLVALGDPRPTSSLLPRHCVDTPAPLRGPRRWRLDGLDAHRCPSSGVVALLGVDVLAGPVEADPTLGRRSRSSPRAAVRHRHRSS